MKYFSPIFLLSALLSFFSCKSTQYTPENYPDAQITFGNGGGFAGTYTNYYLFENGQLFRNTTAKPDFEKVKKVKARTVKQIFNNYKTFQLKDYQFNNPGNMTYYIEHKQAGHSHKIQWGGNNEKVDQKVETIFKILMNLTK